MSGATAGSSAGGVSAAWPADVIHVNEDGWVLVNRGRRHGVVPGLRLLVVGTGIRELRDLFASSGTGAAASAQDQPVALRIRRTYEQLEVVYAEDAVAVAVATRTPPQRRPSFSRGPDGELLVWVPLPEGFTYPQPGANAAPTSTAPDDADDYDAGTDDGDGADAEGLPGDDAGAAADSPPEHGEQDDERWEEALPLNGVAVGDLVVPAIPVAGASAPGTTGAATAEPRLTATPAGEPPTNPFESGRSYDWMKPGE